MSNRLESTSAPLASEFRNSDLTHQLRAICDACVLVVAQTGLTDDEVMQSIEFLRSGQGDRQALSRKMQKLSERRDNEYLKLQEQGDDSTDAEGLRRFSEARAASALQFALSEEPQALYEALYEAMASSDDPTPVISVVRQALRSPPAI